MFICIGFDYTLFALNPFAVLKSTVSDFVRIGLFLFRLIFLFLNKKIFPFYMQLMILLTSSFSCLILNTRGDEKKKGKELVQNMRVETALVFFLY